MNQPSVPRPNELTVRATGPLRGTVQVPGDKSISHRALLLGALADGTSRVENFLPAADCLATLGVVRALGVEVDVSEPAPTTLVVRGRGLHGLQEPGDILNCVRSGTTIRLLAGVLAGQPFFSVLSGEPQLRRRPMARVIEPLQRMGAVVLGRDGGRLPPFAIEGGSLHGIEYTLPVASAQVKSALLLAGLYADGPTVLRLSGPARDHTERLLGAMGCDLHVAHPGRTSVPSSVTPPVNHECTLNPASRLHPVDHVVPGDFSSAAFLLVAATLVPGSVITITGVGVNPTRTGLLDILRSMGADVSLDTVRTMSGEPMADLTVRAAELSGDEVGGELVVRTIDEFPILAVAATQARGQTVVRDAGELRVKETDRIATTVQELRLLGAEIEPQPDGFVVDGPTRLRGATVDSHGDHRLAMALIVAGLIAGGETTVRDVACIGDSFPGFEATLACLGGGLS